jgi:hypothetical protein
MSDQQKPAENDKNKAAAADEEEEDDGYSCAKCCTGYGNCIVAVCKVYNKIFTIVCL